MLLELLEEFHKLKAVTSKQLTSATNLSEKILSKRWLFYLVRPLKVLCKESAPSEQNIQSLLHNSNAFSEKS